MRLVTSCDKTDPQAVVRKEPPPIQAKKRMSAAIRIELATAILSEDDANGTTKLAFAEDFLLEHSVPLAQSASLDSRRRAGKSNPESFAPSQFFGFCS
jgi:hypothetical protein